MQIRLSQCTLIILAGGRSRRMGSDKAQLPIGQSTMLDYIASRLKSHFADIIVSVRFNSAGFPSFRCVPDIMEDAGPLAGMGSAFTVTRTDWNLVIPCDMPDVSLHVLTQLVKGGGETPVTLARFDNCEVSPFPGLYHRSLKNSMLQAIGDNTGSVLHFLSPIPMTIIPIANIPHPVNINTRMDYVRFMKRAVPNGTDIQPSHSEPSRLPLTKWRMADRVGLETVQPPEFGKESTKCSNKPIP